MIDHAKEAGVRTVQDLVRVLGPLYGTRFFTKREELVLSLRIAHDQTLAETAATIGRLEGSGRLTRERVRQIETTALRRFRERCCPHCGGVLHNKPGERPETRSEEA